jgi:hypothetical protein
MTTCSFFLIIFKVYLFLSTFFSKRTKERTKRFENCTHLLLGPFLFNNKKLFIYLWNQLTNILVRREKGKNYYMI